MSAGPTVLQDRYEVKQALGKGAYAQVYRATDRVSSQDVAIKVIHRSPKNFARDAEVQNLQTVHSQPPAAHVVPILDHFFDHNSVCIVMPLLRGGDLYSRVEPNGPGLSKSQARRWIRQLAEAIRSVHQVGLVHADIKPENCLIDSDDNLFLADFGLAVPENHRHMNAVPGTEAYMAPEMLLHNRSGVVMTQAADVFALGITWYAALFADLPWDAASNRDVDFLNFRRTGHLPGPAQSIGLLSFKLHRLIVKMLHPVPAKRATLDEVIGFLEAQEPWFVDSKPRAATPSKAKMDKPLVLPDLVSPTSPKDPTVHCVSSSNSRARRSSQVY